MSLEKEKANLEEEKSYNLRLLELNETKENEVIQIKERHGTYISITEHVKYEENMVVRSCMGLNNRSHQGQLHI